MVSTAQAIPQPLHEAPPPLPAVQRYFEVSLFLLVATGMLSIVTTGKLDLFSTVITSVALIYKALRIWRGRGPEISSRVATGLVLAYFLFFPFDLWVFSRSLAEGAPNPALYAALLAAIHLLLFATLVRLFSARTNRDYAFLAVLAVASMLASAILTVETGFLVALAIFLVLAVSTFVALEIRRSSTGAVSPPFDPGSPMALQLNRALGIASVFVAISALLVGSVIFFLIPRFTTGYLSALNLQPTLMTGFSRQRGARRNRRNQAEHRRGDARSRGRRSRARAGSPLARHRAHKFRWRALVHAARPANRPDGRWRRPIFLRRRPVLPRNDFYELHYTALMEPIATDAIFVAPRACESYADVSRIWQAVRGQASRRSYLLFDQTGSVFNPAHNEHESPLSRARPRFQ